MKLMRPFGLLVVALVASGPASAAQVPGGSLNFKSFHMKGTISAANMKAAPTEVWFRAPDNFRSVTEMMGLKMIALMLGQDFYTYQEGSPMGMKFNKNALPAQAKDADPTQLINQAQRLKASGKKLGSEAVNGRPCDIYEINDQAVRGKVWLWTLNGFPLRSITESNGMSAEMVVTDITLDQPVADTLFKLPTNVQFQDLGALLQNMPAGLDQLQKQFGGQK